jgi:hypothetical protein
MAQENEVGIKTFTAGEALEADRRVKLNAAGTAVVYAGVGDRMIGLTRDKAANGGQVEIKLRNFPGTRRMVAAAAIAAGARIYGAASGKIDDDSTTTGPCEGYALADASGDGSVIEVLPLPGGSEFPGGSVLLFAAVGDSAALGTGSAAEATFSNGSYSLAAGFLKKGDILRVKAKGRLDATHAADTFTAKLKVGTEVIATTPNPDAVNGDIFMIDAEIAVNDDGAGGKLEAMGYVLNGALAAGLALPFHKAQAAEDLSVACDVNVTGQFDAADAGNTAKLDHFTVELLRK